MKKPEYTPREAAFAIAITSLYHAFEGNTDDIELLNGNSTYKKAVKKQVAKLHNRLLQDSKMDGLALEVD